MDYKEFTDLGQQAMMLTEGLIFSEEDYRSNIHKWINGEDNILFIIGLSGSGKTTLGDELAEKYGCKVIHMDQFYHKKTLEDPYFKQNPNRYEIMFDEAIREIGNERGIIEGSIQSQIDKFRDRPIIIKKTSLVTSNWRQLKRTFKNKDQFRDYHSPYAGPVDHLSKLLRHSFSNMKRNAERYNDMRTIEQDLNEAANAKSKYRLYDSFEEFCENINTPEEMKNWFIKTKHIFSSGTSENLRPAWPDEIVRGKPAICFDHAFFIYRWAKAKGYEAHILWAGGFKSAEDKRKGWINGHVVPVILYNGSYICIDVQGETSEHTRMDVNKPGYTFKEFKQKCDQMFAQIKKEAIQKGEFYDQYQIWLSEYDINKIISYENKKNIPTIDEISNTLATGITDDPISEFFNGKIHIEWSPTSSLLYFIRNIFKDPKTTLRSLYNRYFGEDAPLFDFTFYHGSPDKILKFEPVAPNMGNQLEPPKWVVYMFMNKNYAHKFALQRVVQRQLDWNYTVIANYFEPDDMVNYCLINQYEDIKKNLLGQKYYVYTLKVDPDTIGVGHSTHLDEYTTTDPHPKIIKVDEITITKKFLEQNLVALDKDRFHELMGSLDDLQRPTFANIMLDPKDKNKRFKSIMKMLGHGSIVPRIDNLQDVVQSIMQYEEIFKDFPTIEDLGRWIWDNVSEPRKDEKFIWPEEVLKTKKATCIDIAVLLHQYCNINHINHEFGRIGIAYTKNPSSKVVNHQYHIVLIYKITDRKNPENNTTWTIIQNDGPDRLRRIVFKGNSNIKETLELFAKAYLPNMIKQLKSQYPQLVRYVKCLKRVLLVNLIESALVR